MEKIMLVGGLGQIGEEIYPALSYVYGRDNVLVTDLNNTKKVDNFQALDALNLEQYMEITKKFEPSMIIHLPALLSGSITSLKREILVEGNRG
jgi:hypothetical protein